MTAVTGSQDRSLPGAKALQVLLLAPGNHPRRIEKALASEADVAVLDFEDSVAAAEKAAARETAAAAIAAAPRPAACGIRANAATTGEFAEDARAAVSCGAGYLLVPKIEDAAEVEEIDRQLASLEAELPRLERAKLLLIPVIETPRAVVNCEAIALAAPSRAVTLQFGSADLSLALGLELEDNEVELRYVRSRLVVAARAAGLGAPLDGGFLGDLDDLEGVRRDSIASRRLGFGGRSVIHPAHIAPARAGYAELPADLEAWARAVVAEFERAEAEGVAAIRVGGRMVDYPVYRWARERLGLEVGDDDR